VINKRNIVARVLTYGLILAMVILLAANFWRMSRPPRPDPRLVGLAVRATLFALPTPTPYVVEVTRVVEVTPVPPTVTATPLPTATPAALATMTATVTSTPAPVEAAVPVPAPGSSAEEDAAAIAARALPEAAAPESLLLAGDGSGCPTSSDNRYTTVPVVGGGIDHPDAQHADLNLALRSYVPTEVAAALFDKDGPVDGDPPQLAGIFLDNRLPSFGPAGRVYDWNWSCGERGCRSEPLGHVAATLLVLRATAGEPIGIPHRRAQIYGGGYKALVLYAEPTRITLGYTRDDSVANGYAVHLEQLCVDPNLVALYASSTAAGRGSLPALREDEIVGTAGLGDIAVAVRDRGVFFDPRSRLDWWHGY
jgi:hypothetical protein